MWYQLGKSFAAKGHVVYDISRQYEGLVNEETVDGGFYQRVKGYDSPSTIVRLKLLDLFYSLRCLRVLPKSDGNSFGGYVLYRSILEKVE